ncbi:MAG: hypothetical protein ACK41C_17970 [Phenylobacterium sp.]|jgi:hypothetical protein|uniref:hypothetical protein n=1 Tax=Phenylobacterium sp. TaxID=1871053 RepID=UPI0039198003
MHETYELYLLDSNGERRFEALTTLPNQLVEGVRRVLDRSGARACEVHQFGRKLFTLEAGAASAS